MERVSQASQPEPVGRWANTVLRGLGQHRQGEARSPAAPHLEAQRVVRGARDALLGLLVAEAPRHAPPVVHDDEDDGADSLRPNKE